MKYYDSKLNPLNRNLILTPSRIQILGHEYVDDNKQQKALREKFSVRFDAHAPLPRIMVSTLQDGFLLIKMVFAIRTQVLLL